MTITIDEQICREHGLEITDVMLLYIYINKIDVKENTDLLLSLQYMLPSKLKEGQYAFSENTKELVSSIFISSKNALVENIKKNLKKEELTPYKEMAREMIDLYPRGRKEEHYIWRGSESTIADRLRKLSSKFHVKLDKDKVVEATRKYVESFHEDYTFMRTLQYFILKRDESVLLDYLSNLDDLEEDDLISTSELKV